MKKLVIIGGGVAGLTAGIYALERGVGVTVIEKNKSGAGALCGWRREGYEIDGCLHWLTGTKEGTDLNDLWRKVGVLDGEVVKTESFFTSETDGKKVSFYGDASRTAEEMISLYPEDEKEILKLFRAVGAASYLSGTRTEDGMTRAKALLALSPYALLSAGELAERFKSRGMKCAVCDLTGRHYSSLGLIFAYSAFADGNGYLPRGGSAGAATRMTERFKALGGERFAGKRATGVSRVGGQLAVTLSDGNVVTGDRVLCCTDPVRAATTLFDGSILPERFRVKLFKKEKYPLFSSVHFAFSADSADVPFKGTSFVSCRRHTFGCTARDRLMIREYSHEPTFAPEGKSVLQTMIFENEAGCRNWISMKKNGREYTDAKERSAREIKERIVEAYPSLGRSLRLIDSWTPATFSMYLCSVCGSYMSFALTPGTVPASFPVKIRGAEGVYFASQWTRSPGGVPNAAEAGRRAAEAIIKECR